MSLNLRHDTVNVTEVVDRTIWPSNPLVIKKFVAIAIFSDSNFRRDRALLNANLGTHTIVYQ